MSRPTLDPTNSGVVLVLLGLIAQQVGASLAVTLFPQTGPVGAVALRLAFSAAILLIVARPRLGRITAAGWRTAAAFGLVLAAMNVFFYLAIEHIDLGIAVTIEVLGPLTLSVIAGRRWASALCAVTAFAGVTLVAVDSTDVNLPGVICAALAATCWAIYILLSKRTGNTFHGIDGLAIAMSIGSVAVLPLAFITTGTQLLAPHVLLTGLGLAVLSSAVPYALELEALRRIPGVTFAILLALAPAIAGLAGHLLLGQTLTLPAWGGIALVISASAGAVVIMPRPELATARPQAPTVSANVEMAPQRRSGTL